MIVISGASGFIGRRLAARVMAERSRTELICLVKANDDAFGQSGTEFLRSLGIQPVPTELVNGRGLKGLLKPAILFHLAGNTHTWEGNQDCNDVGTKNLLHGSDRLDPRIILFSRAPWQ